MHNKMPITHLSPGDMLDYEGFKIKPFRTAQGWSAVIMRANGKDVLCQGQKIDHYRTTDFTMTKEYAIKHAQDVINEGTVT